MRLGVGTQVTLQEAVAYIGRFKTAAATLPDDAHRLAYLRKGVAFFNSPLNRRLPLAALFPRS